MTRMRARLVIFEYFIVMIACSILLLWIPGQFALLHALLLTVIALCLLGLISVGGVAYYIVNTLIRPKRGDTFLPLTSSVLGLPAEEVLFPPLLGNHLVSGLYVPFDQATSTVILCPGYRRTLKDVLAVGAYLWKAGHNVLIFEFYGHGTVVGTPVTLGYREIHDFLGAVQYAKQRAPGTHLGAMGYSMGASVVIMGSARTPEIEAVIADSAFATHWDAVEAAVHRTLQFSTRLPLWMIQCLRHMTDALLGLRAGYHFDQVEPVRDIGRIAPRPVLLIHGTLDTIVPPDNAEKLYEAAGEPKTLWMIPGSKHAQGYFANSEAYVQRVTVFFEITLKHPTTVFLQETSPLQPVEGNQRKPVPLLQAEHPERKNSTHGSRVSALVSHYGTFIYRFRWAVIVFWTLVLSVSIPLSSRVTNVLTDGGYSVKTSESAQVINEMTHTLNQASTQLLVVLHSDHLSVTSPEYQREIHSIIVLMQQRSHVNGIIQGGIGKDGRSTFISVGFNEDKDTLAQQIPELRQDLSTLPRPLAARPLLTGDAAISSDVEASTQSDTEAAERIALPLALLVLLVVFETLSAALMPLLLAGIAVVSALAIVDEIASHIFSINIFAYNLISVIGLGLAIDYSLFIVRRFREELGLGRSVQEAIATTVATAGEAILFSAVIVFIGFAGLLLIGIEIMSSFAIGGMAVAGIAALAALTLLPAILSVLGTRINALRVPMLSRLSGFRMQILRGTHQSFWQRWAYFVMRWPILVILLVLALLVFLGWPARALNPGVIGVDALSPSYESRQALTLLQAQIPQDNLDPLVLIARSSDGSSMLSPQNLHRVAELTHWIAGQSHVTRVTSLMNPSPTSKAAPVSEQSLLQLYRSGKYLNVPGLSEFVRATTHGDMTMIGIDSNTLSGSHDDQVLIDHLRLPVREKAGLITQLGGSRAITQDFDRVLYNGFFTRTLPFTVIVTFVVLLFTFRSVFLPLKAIVMNVLSITVSYGVLVWIFQDGNLQDQLSFTSNGIIDRFLPPLLFSVLFGLSTDYEVFLLSRVRESWLRTHDNRRAVALGVEKTGDVITNAAILFMIVSAAFIASQLLIVKQLGVSLFFAIGLDSTIIRLLLVPASMQILGKWNWWFPGRAETSREVGNQSLQTSNAFVPEASPPRIDPLSERAISRQIHMTEQVLRRVFAKVLAVPLEKVEIHTDFLLSGGDSDSLAALLGEIQQHFNFPVSAADVFEHSVLSHLASVISEKQGERMQEKMQGEFSSQEKPVSVTPKDYVEEKR